MNVTADPPNIVLPTWCRKLFAGLLTVGTLSSQAATIVDDFNTQIPNGNLPTFATAYGFVGSPYSSPTPGTFAGELFPEGLIGIVASSADVHGLWAVSPTLPPEGSGFYLAVNGFTSVGKVVYQRGGLPVTPGATYEFQADLTSLFNEAPADLQFSIEFLDAGNVVVNGVTAPTVAPDFGAGWQTTVLPGVVPAGAVTARITLNNLETAASGNDFGVDNIAFTLTVLPPPPPPPPSTNDCHKPCKPKCDDKDRGECKDRDKDKDCKDKDTKDKDKDRDCKDKDSKDKDHDSKDKDCKDKDKGKDSKDKDKGKDKDCDDGKDKKSSGKR